MPVATGKDSKSTPRRHASPFGEIVVPSMSSTTPLRSTVETHLCMYFRETAGPDGFQIESDRQMQFSGANGSIEPISRRERKRVAMRV
jgi:hypothetical protein